MGIPKFFRFISERWPNISQLIDGTQIPEFDNFYLDMNSILHTCTRAKEGESNKRLSEEEVFTAIFAYIDHLFDTIQPKKVFYMAIDGVAPRAKMNQQRSRRFRTAIDAEKALANAIEKGEEIPAGEPFDSNSITPGTEFMGKLTRFLKYFIHKKVSNDSKWQNVEIILSGHEVPGEGEHKIMDFIRTKRSLPTYDPNTRHCIYGLDADLIMLGLVSHDPHFALLREEVTFGRNSQKAKSLEEQKFYLLHLSLVREYLELEFKELESEVKFTYDFERILDDFVLIMYVIGNDFLPNLPDLHLNKGAFPLLLETFKQSLRSVDGYINEFGKINLQRLGVWLDYLSKFELENFEQGEVDLEWFNKQLENVSITGEKKRLRTGKIALLKKQKKLIGIVKPWLIKTYSTRISPDLTIDEIPTLELAADVVADNQDFLKEFAFELDLFLTRSASKGTYSLKVDVDGMDPHESDEEFTERSNNIRRIIKRYENAVILDSEGETAIDDKKTVYNEKFEHWKDQYYKEKFGFSIKDDDEMQKLTENYVEGLQWVLYYYFQGCSSWPWYFQYHYAPRISDIKRALGMKIEFNLGTPFKPYEQLMSVLPSRSNKLVPAPYRKLMLDENSVIKDFYPMDVEYDMNGKTAEWEAVVKLSFVDEKRLKDALAPLEPLLNEEEKFRNSFGRDIQFKFNPQIEQVFKSPLAGIFADLENNHCFEVPYVLEKLTSYHTGLVEGVLLGNKALAGFPTLKSIPFTNELKNAGLLIFNQPSRSQSQILTPKDIHEGLTVDQFADRYVGEIVWTRYPYLRESKITRVVDGKFDYRSRGQSFEMDSEDVKTYKSTLSNVQKKYMSSKGLELKSIRALVYVKPVTGLKRTSDGAYVKDFTKEEEVYPLQLVVENVSQKDHRYVEKAPLPIDKEFPVGSKTIFLGDYAYGGEAVIDGYSTTARVKISVNKLSHRAEPTIGSKLAHKEVEENIFYPSFEVARTLKLHPLFLSKITSSCMIETLKGQRANIGLDLKFEAKREKVIGYTKKLEKGWGYSIHAINLLKEYRKLFPDFFEGLINNPTNGGQFPKLANIYNRIKDPKQIDDKLKQVQSWLKAVKSTLVRASLESDSLSSISMQEIEAAIELHALEADQSEIKKMEGVPRDAILDPKVSFSRLSSQTFHLGDRVVYVHDSGKVPLFSKGTVVSYTSLGSNVTLNVLFDKVIMGGNKLDGRIRTNRGLAVDSSLVLNISRKQFVYHSSASKTKKSKPVKAKAKPAAGPAAAPAKKVLAKRTKPEGEAVALVSEEKKEKVDTKAKPKKTQVKKDKAANDLLSLLKGEKKPETAEDTEPQQEEEESTPTKNFASKAIQNQILNNLNGVPQMPQMPMPPIPFGMPPIPGPFNGFIPQVFPVPPGYIPFPPMNGNMPFPPMPQQQQQQQQMNHAPVQTNGGSDSAPSTGSLRGQSSGRGNRGRGRGGHRGGNRGGNRGGKNSSAPSSVPSSASS
ncbi:hypothetical protein WICPIJ_003743 [Wickerhamomyces pijperi]|uniref:5'-3' exoribonuclease 1 n=1 Tax=Wickerhamomyces pijperi TaxID=599730 RepID=A0A9P8Q9A7_WICPI|nr:hypothetical protein WICPIJ_003743 [Wickerhamomyces pijperi]